VSLEATEAGFGDCESFIKSSVQGRAKFAAMKLQMKVRNLERQGSALRDTTLHFHLTRQNITANGL
jgi:hypothetical protein